MQPMAADDATSEGTAADHVAIQRLTYRYAIALDNLDVDGLAACFAPDGVLRGGGVDLRGESIAGDLVGLHRRRRASRGIDHSMHQVTSQFHELGDDGSTAAGTTYCVATQFWGVNDQRTKVDLYIKYRDEFVRRDGRWYFSLRELNALFFTEVPVLDWTLLPKHGEQQAPAQ